MIDRPEGGERVILVHLLLRAPHPTSDLQEFRELALSAGATVVAVMTATRDTPDSRFYIGSGKVEELKSLILAENCDLVIFNHELTPTQERNLEKALKCRVLDRTGLILDIFAQRAQSYEGKLQVELARLKHLSTRLIRGWTHLERQRGGIGLRGGPGETQLEVDRRLIRNRINHITERLVKVRKQRSQSRRARQKADVATISLVGYTNVGKSTLFNALTDSEVFVANQLFATLDPVIRSRAVPILGKVVFADTVGFVSNLPHELIDAFRATLEEVKEADLILHVIDGQDAEWRLRVRQVESVLQEIGALAVPRIEVYNKIDLLENVAPHVERDHEGHISRVFVSAQKSLGLSLLVDALVERLQENILRGEIVLLPHQARARAMLYEANIVLKETALESGEWLLRIAVPKLRWQQLCHEEPELEKSWKV